MSNKLQKTTENGQSAGMEITGQIIEYVLAAVAAAICMAVPLYARNGYDQIGNICRNERIKSTTAQN